MEESLRQSAEMLRRARILTWEGSAPCVDIGVIGLEVETVTFY